MTELVTDVRDAGCDWPECGCRVPYYAFSAEPRRHYCKKFHDHNKKAIAEFMKEHKDD